MWRQPSVSRGRLLALTLGVQPVPTQRAQALPLRRHVRDNPFSGAGSQMSSAFVPDTAHNLGEEHQTQGLLHSSAPAACDKPDHPCRVMP
jgi:hypothetical protein